MELLRYRRIAFSALAVKSLPLVYGGAVILFVNTHLSRELELGVYSLSIATFFVVSMIGKSFALYPLIKFISEGQNDQGTWQSGTLYWIGSQLVGALFIYGAAPFAPALFHAPGLDEGMRWASCIIIAFIPRDLASALLQARREIGRLFILEGCYFLVAAGGIAYFALSGMLQTADQVLGLNLLGGIISTIAAPFICYGRIPSWKKPDREDWMKMASYGRDSLGIGIGDTIYTQLDYHLLGLFMGASEVALYFAAKNFFRFYNAVTQAINLLIFPTSSNLFARGEIPKLRELIEKVVGGYLLFLLIINIVVLIGADLLVEVVYRGIFPDAANVLRIFALASFFEPLYMVSENVLYGIGKPRAILIAMWTSIILFGILAVVLMPLFGAVGGALTILGTLLSLSFITMWFLKKEIQVTLFSIVRRNFLLLKHLSGSR